jgi:mRNA deadenylase 3'-5' endonuclease subunit Ccr4
MISRRQQQSQYLGSCYSPVTKGRTTPLSAALTTVAKKMRVLRVTKKLTLFRNGCICCRLLQISRLLSLVKRARDFRTTAIRRRKIESCTIVIAGVYQLDCPAWYSLIIALEHAEQQPNSNTVNHYFHLSEIYANHLRCLFTPKSRVLQRQSTELSYIYIT